MSPKGFLDLIRHLRRDQSGLSNMDSLVPLVKDQLLLKARAAAADLHNGRELIVDISVQLEVELGEASQDWQKIKNVCEKINVLLAQIDGFVFASRGCETQLMKRGPWLPSGRRS